MKTIAFRILLSLSAFVAPALFSACDAPISEYAPGGPDEKEILSVVMQYQEAKNHFDIDRLLSFLHNGGTFTFKCGMMVSKAKLGKDLPVLWAALQEGDSSVIPLVHECINGDCYKTGALYNPKVVIDGDKAEVTVLYKKSVCKVLEYFTMCRENGRWLITKTEWGHC